MLKGFLLVTMAVLPVSVSVSSAAQARQDVQTSARPDSSARAKELYKRDCLICHGVNGDGKTGIVEDRGLVLLDWTDAKSLAGRSDQQLFHAIRYGKGKMPAESAGRASDDEVRQLIRYIRAMARSAPGVPPPATPVSPQRE